MRTGIGKVESKQTCVYFCTPWKMIWKRAISKESCCEL